MVRALSKVWPVWNISLAWSNVGVLGSSAGPQLTAWGKATKQLAVPPDEQPGEIPTKPRPYFVCISGRLPTLSSEAEVRSEYFVEPPFPCWILMIRSPWAEPTPYEA